MSSPSVWISILDGIIAELQSITAQTGGAVTTDRPIYECARYFGQFDGERALEGYGISGRTPAVLVDFAGEKSVLVTIGRRKQKLEGTFVAICCTDAHRTPADRDRLFGVLDLVRAHLVSKRVGVAITPLQYTGITVYRELPQLAAYGLQFTTQYWLDLTTRPADAPALGHVEGGITDPDGNELGKDKVSP